MENPYRPPAPVSGAAHAPGGLPDPAAVRAWLIAQYRKGSHRDHQVASQESDVPEDYGDFSIHDGINLIAAGSSRNLRATFRHYLDRLLRAEVPIFLWTPDSDGHVREWLDGDHEADPDACPMCDGTGEVECRTCGGTGKVDDDDD